MNFAEFQQFGGRKILKENVVPRFNVNVPHISGNSSMNKNEQFNMQDTGDCSLSAETEECNLSSTFSSNANILQPPVKLYKSQVVQVKPSTENKWSQTIIRNENKASQAVAENRSVSVCCNFRADLVKQLDTLHVNKGLDEDKNMDSSFDTLDTSSSYKISSGTSNEEEKLKDDLTEKVIYENFTKRLIEKNPQLYLGIRKESMYIIDLLHEECSISVRDIYLTLKKVKLNLPFSVLGHEFGLSESQASRVFNKSVKIMALKLKQLIVWPSKQQIMFNLPIHFRYRYNDVESIIDCFEIEIEKPSDACNQAMTWSEYKKCNTVKYLISVTPDGHINFISEGVCGRCTDMSIVENCGYLDTLPDNVKVMADRGFKQLDVQLTKKKCILIRPPSVSQNTQSSKSDVKLTKQIASLRIHVERVINRIRNFKFVDIHTRIDNKLLQYLDSAVFIASGLVNLQSEVIKQI